MNDTIEALNAKALMDVVWERFLRDLSQHVADAWAKQVKELPPSDLDPVLAIKNGMKAHKAELNSWEMDAHRSGVSDE